LAWSRCCSFRCRASCCSSRRSTWRTCSWREAARGTDNLLPFIKDALRDRASLGEVCGAMQDVFGKYAPTF